MSSRPENRKNHFRGNENETFQRKKHVIFVNEKSKTKIDGSPSYHCNNEDCNHKVVQNTKIL